MQKTKTRQEVMKEFDRAGTSVAQWARERGLNQSLTYQVLRGEKKGRRGQSHRIAVLLGIKEGTV